ncbi:MAG TPA: hypothetical protein VN723_16060 [Rhizomicrobium sp.]|nr:hypothetical protein [Rhizomicrobium sp.]
MKGEQRPQAHEKWRVGIIALIVLAATIAGAKAAELVDYAYAPALWQTAIGLIDDPDKSVVDKSGTLLYDFSKGFDGAFATRISIDLAPDTQWVLQRVQSPKIPIVITQSQVENLAIAQEEFSIAKPARSDVVHVLLHNSGPNALTLSPSILIDTAKALRRGNNEARIDKTMTVTASLRFGGLRALSKTRRALRLARITVPAHGASEFYVRIQLEGKPNTAPLTNELGASLKDQALAYWKDALLPYGHVQVPDEQIQALFDASIRNIWQAREIKSGLPAFQVGPTVYRSLWVVDGAFILEAAAMLGAGQEARAGIARELTYQKADGGIEVLKGVIKEGLGGKPWPQENGGSEANFNYSKENGIALWTFLRHAQLTQDKSWLATIYPKMQQIAEHIRQLRLPKNSTSPDAGLIPPGSTDGGQNGFVPEYSNTLWNLVGIRAFVEAARWLGKDADAARWQAEYDDFLATFHRAAARDLKTDSFGNRYLPNRMDGADLPQRAQWAFMQAVYPGEVLAKDDPIVVGNLAMLQATLKEGMVYGSGWDEHGIWTYLGSFFAHALLWKGDDAAVTEQLYAFANHASPTFAWREEQTLKEQPFSPTGDMPHNWASAEFIRLVIHMMELDRGKELHLLEALPGTWLKPNAVTSLSKVATPFGPLTMNLTVSPDGKTAKLHVEAVSDPSCTGIVVHSPGTGALVTLAPNTAHDLALNLR